MTKCKKCGEQMGDDEKFCSNCGRNQKKKGIFKQTLYGIIGAIVVITALDALTNDGDGGAEKAQAEKIPLPQSQTQFVAAVQDAIQAADDASNDMAKGGVRADRAESVCRALGNSRSVQGWIGEIDTVDSNSDGKGVLAVSLADNVTVTTWNNALSDIGTGSLIEPSTSLFKTASTMSPGDLVVFSGRFTSDDVDCVGEQSMTLNGSLDDPEYTMVFSSVSAYAPES